MTTVMVEIQDRNKFQVNKGVKLQCTSCMWLLPRYQFFPYCKVTCSSSPFLMNVLYMQCAWLFLVLELKCKSLKNTVLQLFLSYFVLCYASKKNPCNAVEFAFLHKILGGHSHLGKWLFPLCMPWSSLNFPVNRFSSLEKQKSISVSSSSYPPPFF